MEDPDAYSVLIYLIRHRYNRRAICEVIRNYLLIKRILARETSSAETYDEHGNNGNAAHWSGALAVFPFRDIDQIGCSWMTGRDSSTPAEQLRVMLSHCKMDTTMEDRFPTRLMLGGRRFHEVRKGMN